MDPNAKPRSTCSIKECPGTPLLAEESCLEHAPESQFEEFLKTLQSGDSLTLRDTQIHAVRFNRILKALGDDEKVPQIGEASFQRSRFHGPINFWNASFNARSSFPNCTFEHGVSFRSCRFSSRANFTGATFRRHSNFARATFLDRLSLWGARFDAEVSFFEAHMQGRSKFENCTFSDAARFAGAKFEERVNFKGACFEDVTFEGARFGGGLSLIGIRAEGRFRIPGATIRGTLNVSEAQFLSSVEFGPIVCGHEIVAHHSVWDGRTRISAATPRMDLSWTRFEKSLKLDIRHAEIFLDGVMFEEPTSVTAATDPFRYNGSGSERSSVFAEDCIPESAQRVAPLLASLHSADLSNLSISGINLAECRFTKSHNLEKLRIDGDDAPFGHSPSGWRCSRRFPWISYWSNRKVIAEERHWRSSRKRGYEWSSAGQGQAPEAPSADAVAQVYRSLRRAREESKNEPRSGDFYYGEMEMRKNSTETSSADRVVIWMYWAVSGYGLRASRAFTVLLLLLLSLSSLAYYVGFADPPPGYGVIVLQYVESMLTIRGEGPVARLNTVGASIRVFLKIAGPILLGLGLLAIRNRVKR
ncbi:pentapeptide repeat-containing protein [Streptomyces sp. KCTC 0041BP]|nr:pentapeptide repeat-containing protein [Streptomyces sp. KCTC 0041BP]